MNTNYILLVEDNSTDEVLTLRSLRRAALANEVVVVRDGEEALDHLFMAGVYAGSPYLGPPALILLDLNLPKIGGLDVLRRIRADERTRVVPVVVLTSSDEDRDLIDSYGSGANSYVRKPVEYTSFTEIVHQLGLYWLIVNEAPPAKS
jgi:two-component system response regulator